MNSFKIIADLGDCPLGQYWYLVRNIKSFPRYFIEFTPTFNISTHPKEWDTLMDALIFPSSHYEVYQFDNRVDFSKFRDKLILVEKLKK
jgi:hypothetical protein